MITLLDKQSAKIVAALDDLIERVDQLIEHPDPEAEAALIKDGHLLKQVIQRQMIETTEDFAPHTFGVDD